MIKINRPELVIDPTEGFQGFLGPKWEDRQKFQILVNNTVELSNGQRTLMEMEEFLMKDQHGNYYIAYQAQLMDGETWVVEDWIRPQTLKEHTGPLGRIQSSMFEMFRAKAWRAFVEADKKIKAKLAGMDKILSEKFEETLKTVHDHKKATGEDMTKQAPKAPPAPAKKKPMKAIEKATEPKIQIIHPGFMPKKDKTP
jgi:hypothetical protein